nr:sugar ABC transporter permease [Clostridium cavendishii]
MLSGKKKQKRGTLEKHEAKWGYIFLLPNFVGFLIFTLIPVVAALIMSFTNWDGFGNVDFTGFKNYLLLLKDQRFIDSFVNTIYFTIGSVPLTIIVALAVALALNQKLKGISALRAAYFLPYISSVVAVAVVWQALYNPDFGPLNSLIKSFGITDPPTWLSSTAWALPAVILMSVWKTFGYYMVMFLAGLQGIPKYLYEAAELDGCTGWQKFKNITLPMLSPTTFFVTIMCIINSFKVFDQIYVMTQGGPGTSTTVLVYNIYCEAFQKYNFGYASAQAFVFFALILMVTLIQFRGQKKWVNY